MKADGQSLQDLKTAHDAGFHKNNGRLSREFVIFM